MTDMTAKRFWEYALQRTDIDDSQPSWVFEPFHESRDKSEIEKEKKDWESDGDLSTVSIKIVKRRITVGDWIDDD